MKLIANRNNKILILISNRPPVFQSSPSMGVESRATTADMKFGSLAGGTATDIESKDDIPDDMIL